MNKEVEYRAIPGHEGYRVGSDGTVWSCWKRGHWNKRVTAEWRQLKPGRCAPVGYRSVALPVGGGKLKSHHVHRLVLLAFVGPLPEGQCTRHLNGVPGDDRLENLAYGTESQNQMDRVAHGTSNRGERHGMAKADAGMVREIRKRYSSGETPTQLAKSFPLSRRAIRDIAVGKRWGHIQEEECAARP